MRGGAAQWSSRVGEMGLRASSPAPRLGPGPAWELEQRPSQRWRNMAGGFQAGEASWQRSPFHPEHLSQQVLSTLTRQPPWQRTNPAFPGHLPSAAHPDPPAWLQVRLVQHCQPGSLTRRALGHLVPVTPQAPDCRSTCSRRHQEGLAVWNSQPS